jgi:superfamily II DNA or RNA helicase
MDTPRMSLKERDWDDRYSSSDCDLVSSFYEPALRASNTFKRATGYFRSSIYSLVGRDVADFVLREGQLQILCSPELDESDIAEIRRGTEIAAVLDDASRREIRRALEHPMAGAAAEFLGNLLAMQALEVRFALTPQHIGVFHDKVGVFSDGTYAVSFSGSINETWRGWHPLGNHESFEVFTSWADGHRVRAHDAYFDRLWNGEAQGVEVYSAPRAFAEEILRHASPDPHERLAMAASSRRQTPPSRRLFDHQQEALACWQSRGRRGVLKHATGSGKTLTALHGIRDWIAQGNAALVLVPSTLLLQQWQAEAARELSSLDPSVLLAGDGNDAWRSGGLLRLHTQVTGPPRLVIATMQTASTPEFQRGVADGSHLLVVADEAHRTGASRARACLPPDAGARLGLSATPERAGDSEGTAMIFQYFGDVLEPVFTLRDAIRAKRLTPYAYYPDRVTLTAEETDAWVEQTKQIKRVYAQNASAIQRGESHEALQLMLIKRARIAKQAANKAPIATEIVRERFKPGQHWLVYCDDQKQLRAIRSALLEASVDALEYHSAMTGDRPATLARYRDQGGVLVSIRCLDEGVDIPEITHAVIVASSRNPREFIQRRGRVLRRSADKSEAVIHDLLVLPNAADGQSDLDGLVLGEIARAERFAQDARNPAAAAKVKRWCIELGIDPDALVAAGLEEDEDQELTEEGTIV